MLKSVIRTGPFRPLLWQHSTPRMMSSTAVRFSSVNHRLNKDSVVYKYLEEGPKYVKYSSDHEWLAGFNDDTAFIGITGYASNALGDVTFIELPEVGVSFEKGEAISSVESVKSASEVYAPVAGEVVAVNDVLGHSPQLINDDPMGEGWIAQIKLADPESVENSEDLLTAEQYESSLEES